MSAFTAGQGVDRGGSRYRGGYQFSALPASESVARGGAKVLLRRVIGDALRARRQAQHRTLREVSTAANVSLGYLSEIERGQKEASSELLAAICEALGAALSEVLRDVSDKLAGVEEPRVLVPVGGGGDEASDTPARSNGATPSGATSGNGTQATARPTAVGAPAPAANNRTSAGQDGARAAALAGSETSSARRAHTPNAKMSVADGTLSVAVHYDGPLKTTLRATRAPRERDVERDVVCAA